MTVHRRSFLAGLGALIAAPAIVRVSALMPVKAIPISFAGIPDYVPVGNARVDVLWGWLRLDPRTYSVIASA